MSNQQLVVTLQLVKGDQILKDEQGRIANTHQSAKYIYGSGEWVNALKQFVSLGFGRAEVTEVTKRKEKTEKVDGVDVITATYEKIETPENIVAELKAIFAGKVVELTPDQQRIADLESKLEALMSANMEDPEVAALKEARERYEQVAGKKGGPKWTVEEINEKIAEIEAAKA